ncbi:helix-turn-helix domain-containing protein [Dawidia soli]|uniref:AraC family transcriptional regulator n=1 Tax=Dawidia soli TaxID=2782352 RepID=A0AAP2DEE3_9BACT|nr:helix-turn-helix domain-containing protein [Dawidia soli]MBT1690238.1 AraC family transcriptional regulator [Dawidia soli]
MTMSRKKQAITLHENELKSIGISVAPFSSLTENVRDSHRDDHYMFIIQQHGRFVWEFDFQEVVLKDASLSYVIPGQVHRYVSFHRTAGWFVFVAPDLIDSTYREIFDAYLHSGQGVPLKKGDAVFTTTLLLVEMLDREPQLFRERLSRSLVDTLAGMVASRIAEAKDTVAIIGGPKYHTVLRFKKLVKAHCKEKKQVQDYAALLHITPLYLNEVVKDLTGFSASYWIQQEILLEAKRMLRYAVLDIKQIAFDLGYADHAYFSRFFRKHTGVTATDFRASHYLSNHSH